MRLLSNQTTISDEYQRAKNIHKVIARIRERATQKLATWPAYLRNVRLTSICLNAYTMHSLRQRERLQISLMNINFAYKKYTNYFQRDFNFFWTFLLTLEKSCKWIGNPTDMWHHNCLCKVVPYIFVPGNFLPILINVVIVMRNYIFTTLCYLSKPLQIRALKFWYKYWMYTEIIIFILGNMI